MAAPPRRSLFLVLLLSILSQSLARSSLSLEGGSSGLLAVRDSSSSNQNSEQPAGASQLNPVGTKDAPIDGKDGKPHAGPFVETEAQRDRMKAKGFADEEPAVITLTGPAKEQPDLRPSNDGVMDDPHRVSPKDGTRGTEGGVSEKSKEKKMGEEKKPDPPKEAPPLPHSEQEMMKDHHVKDLEKESEEEKKPLEVTNLLSIVTCFD
jgi:Ca2+/H+ antiporter, TMEM165/GDT1 family